MAELTAAFKAFPGPIPAASRALLHIRTASMSGQRPNWSLWAARIDQIIQGRLDRKGVLHTTSYARRDRFLELSRWADQGVLLAHGSRDMARALRRFAAAPAPAVLVSPALVRGISFDRDLARYGIVGKVPWPPPSPLLDARSALDPDCAGRLALRALEQELGRLVRAEDDWAELFCVDDFVVPFLKRYGKYATAAFRESWAGSVTAIPAARPLGEEVTPTPTTDRTAREVRSP